MEEPPLSWNKRFMVIAAALIAVSMPVAAHAQRGRRIVRPVIVPPPLFWDFYGWGYPGVYPSASYGRHVVDESAARIQVTPRDTEVYVDGYRAGIVDDFDGFAQRLRVAPGEHVIELFLDGHKPVAQAILFRPGETYRIRHAMEPLGAGEAAPARPTPRMPAATPGPPPAYDALGRPIGRVATPGPVGVSGVIAIRVQPGDAVIFVDGERWQSSSSDRLEIQVSPGAHRIEVQKEGYQPFTTNIQVRPGETAAVNVSLTRSQEVELRGFQLAPVVPEVPRAMF
jgi:hypothetical protein